MPSICAKTAPVERRGQCGKWLFILLILALATPASAATVVLPHPELGHLLVLTDEAQVYVRTDAQSAIFTAALPLNGAYSILVDGDQNGAWGEGAVPDRNRSASPASPDFAYASDHGTICSQYIYVSYQTEPDLLYGSSFCDLRKSAATLRTVITSNGVSLQTYTIPKSELRNGPGEVHFAIDIWNGSGDSVFGSPSTPFVLTLAK
jgi:hypothetical protein